MEKERQVVVDIRNLSKKYSPKADYAVRDVNLKCFEGEIVGLLGHNGAGKSTTLKCLMGMLPFSEGEIEICGFSIKSKPIEAKSNFGFVTDNHSVFVKMTGIQYLLFMANVYQVETDVREERIEKMENIFHLGKSLYNLISSYSHGMKQKICMMGSLMHMPKLWILDEPMTGLDPMTMRAVTVFMKEYVKLGNTILFSSHDLNSVEKICDRAVVVNHGKQKADINIKEFLKQNADLDLEEYFFKDEK